MKLPQDYGPGLSPEKRQRFVREVGRYTSIGFVAVAVFTLSIVALFS